LRDALSAVWQDPHIEEITAEDLCGKYPAVAYGPPDDTLPIYVLTRLGEAFSFEGLESQVREVDGHAIVVVRR
jgi:hypothetical protein